MRYFCLGQEQCLAECEGHQWEVAPYFEPSPNAISYCYRNQNQILICKEDPASRVTLSPQSTIKSLATYATVDAGATGDLYEYCSMCIILSTAL